MELMFVTSNSSKVKLANERLGRYGITVLQVLKEVLEPQLFNVEEVAISKAEQLSKKLRRPFIVEDSGLYINKLNGFPGALMKPILDSIGGIGLLKLMENEKDRKILVKSVLVYCNPKTHTIKSFLGVYSGTLSKQQKGKNTRGWKVARIFVPKNSNKTLAMLNDQEWQKFLNEFRKKDHYESFGRWIASSHKG